MNKIKWSADLDKLRNDIKSRKKLYRKTISVCCGPGCSAVGANELARVIRNKLEKTGLDKEVSLKETGCLGFCEQAPVLLVKPDGIFYCKVEQGDVDRILDNTVKNGEVVEDLLYLEKETGERIYLQENIPFYRYQHRMLTGNNAEINPFSLEDYLAVGGYRGLQKALEEMRPVEVLEEVKAAELRGRGGGGFPTGRKWEAARQQLEQARYVICNADEGDPGCFQDRTLVEGNPHLVLEGMLLGAYAVGAREGYIYIRYEYPLAVKSFNEALRQAREYGLLGENILGSDFSFEVKVKRGGGAFVCGESSALIASIEGETGEPRDKYVRNTERGLWGKPTVLNNVKSWASVPHIIDKGADWFSGIGTENSKGTMIFSLTGKVNHTGLVEVPMGASLEDLVYRVGGGVSGGKKLKAVQTGGPSGGCIPAGMMELSLDYESLKEVGSMMGSGGMIVMDEETCMVDVARYFLSFTQEESCGKCVPCREGGRQLLELLNGITRGEGKEKDLSMVREISRTMQHGAFCNLGKQAPNPVLTTFNYFMEEYREHVVDKKCRAGVCRDLISYYINEDNCNGCGRCLQECPAGAVYGEKNRPHTIDLSVCNRCGICREVCRHDAVVVE